MAAARFPKLHDIWTRFSSKGAYPHELAFLLLRPLRRFILSRSSSSASS